jgi:hypothetical protein
MANIVIDVAAEFTGKKAFDQAQKSTFNLEKSAKKLAGAFGLAFGTTAIVNFSKAAVKAFAEDEAAANRLARAVENLGIGFANPAIAKYISELERTAAIADDILRPAFQGLLTTTGSLTKSQQLLNNAITISRASGIDLATVSQDLANGYVGITKGLKKYNTGLTTAELSSKSFAEVLGVLLTRSAGAADDYLETTQYRMDSLTIATGNASEILGGGLVDAFAAIGGGTEASDAAAAIESIATAIANVTTAAGKTIGAIPNLLANLKKLGKDIFLGFAGAQAGVKLTSGPKAPPPPKPDPSALAQQKALAKLEADALKRQKALLALQKKQTDAAKKAAADQAKLAKADSIFNLEKIQIEAALKGKISEEEKVRLLLMRAILDEDVATAETLEKKLADIQKKNAEIAADLAIIAATKDPFATWAGSLSQALVQLAKYGKSMADINATTFIPGVNFNPAQNADRNYDAAVAAVVAATNTAAAAAALAAMPTNTKAISRIVNPTPTPVTNNPFAGLGGPSGAGSTFNPGQNFDRNYDARLQAPTVIVNNNGTTIMQDEFVTAVADALVIADTQGRVVTRPGGTTSDTG